MTSSADMPLAEPFQGLHKFPRCYVCRQRITNWVQWEVYCTEDVGVRVCRNCIDTLDVLKAIDEVRKTTRR